jgi:hypothetical protein
MQCPAIAIFAIPKLYKGDSMSTHALTYKELEIIAEMIFGLIVWSIALYHLCKKSDTDESVANVSIRKSSGGQREQPKLMLNFLTMDQILELTADQIKAADSEEVDKLPAALKSAFLRRKNDVLFEERKKEANK